MTRIYHHCFTVPPEAIDVNRHVNNIEYVRWMQEAAIAHSTVLGWPMEALFEKRCSWVARSHFVEYLRPAYEGDELRLLTWVSSMSERSSVRQYLLWRPKDGKLLSKAETVWVFVDTRAGLPRQILAEVREAFPIVEDEAEALAQLVPA